MDLTIVQRAFDELFDSQGVERKVFDDTASITMAAGDVALSVVFRASADDVVLTAVLGQVPYWAANDVRAALMEANFAWKGGFGRTFAWCRGLGAPVLMERLTEADLSLETLGAKMIGFLESAETWHLKLDELLSELDEDDELAGLGEEAQPETELSEAAISPMSMASFLRV